uniref:Ectonucleoside triphosphate diphosphohydrolase 3 n=1 Tax=Sphaeramia orbicularis TaxID=375764 RepID=A0A673CL47_9TELE
MFCTTVICSCVNNNRWNIVEIVQILVPNSKILTIFCLLPNVYVTLCVKYMYNNKSRHNTYGIVIDSGSSRSNVFLYEWPGEKENETGVVSELMNCRVAGDGISEMKTDPEKDAASWEGFKTCMDNITEKIPAEKHKSTPLFLGATAGMRLLQEKDENRSKEIMTSLREYLGSLPFAFQDASIITGQENLWNKYIHPDGAKTVGSMDLGGASTQIAFAVNEDLIGPDYMEVKLYGYPYNVYTHSFLCYGKNEAEKRVLAKAAPNPNRIMNPCYPTGFNVTMKASSIYDTTCTTKPKNYNPDQELFMEGEGSSEKCERIVKSIFDFDTCSATQCSFDGVEQPPVVGDFMAYAGFFYTNRAMQIEGPPDLDKFNASITKFCETEWTQVALQKYKNKHKKTYCYSGHYVFTLLADGYKFDHETWKNIAFEKEVKNTSIGWSLGYMLSMSNMIPSDVTEIPPMTNPTFAGLIFLFSALTIITVVCVFIILIRTCY